MLLRRRRDVRRGPEKPWGDEAFVRELGCRVQCTRIFRIGQGHDHARAGYGGPPPVDDLALTDRLSANGASHQELPP